MLPAMDSCFFVASHLPPSPKFYPLFVVGIGLNEVFIIAGEHFCTDPRIDAIERIRMTMNAVSHSICLTTIATTFAFLLGLMSSLPGVKWLCIYAFTTIFIDFIFQITLFLAFIVIDERRIHVLCCLKTADHPDNKAKKKAAEMAKAAAKNIDNDKSEHHTKRKRQGTVTFPEMTIVNKSVAKERRQSEAIPAAKRDTLRNDLTVIHLSIAVDTSVV